MAGTGVRHQGFGLDGRGAQDKGPGAAWVVGQRMLVAMGCTDR